MSILPILKTVHKFLYLCSLTRKKAEPLTIDEIAKAIECSKGHAYNYRRALEHLYPKELLEQVYKNRKDKSVQQSLA